MQPHPASSASASDGLVHRLGIDAITPAVASRVRLPAASRFDRLTLADHVRRYPDTAFASEDGREYVIAGPWRRREDIAELIEASPGNRRRDLVDELARSLTGRGVQLLVIDYGLDASDPTFFRSAGFEFVERIFEYERPEQPLKIPTLPDHLKIQSYRSVDRDAVLEVERESFPWLWWNSAGEWDTYVVTPGVEIIVGSVDGRIVGYAGFVVYRHEGHLDRLAVRESEHGRHFGAALLVAALTRMRDRGTRRIALTTQDYNLKSQKLYEQNGFRRGRWSYDIYGRWLNQAESGVR